MYIKDMDFCKKPSVIINMFKYYVVFALCLCIPSTWGFTEEMQELIDMLHGTCVNETGVPEDVITKVNTEKVMVDDDKLKCYIKCLLSQMGCMTEEGHVDVEAVLAMLPEDMKDVQTPIIKKCGSKVGKDACESAWLTHKCYLKTNPKVYTLV